MDYPYAKFGDYIFSRFGFITQTTHTERIADAAKRFTPAMLSA